MQPGTVLNNRYHIVNLLAEGGMAKVYKAHDQLLDRLVAIKVLREQFANDQAFLEGFQQEARAAAALAHPNIVSIHDVGADNGVNYIVMELVDGPNLKQVIQQDGACAPARAIDVALQILAALGYAHERGIVHRDVKPQNILISTQGHAKVTDFGIARAAKASQLTETGLVMGSVHYCAPEQAMGKASTQTSDVYSLGVVLFEMLAGHLPFESDSVLGVALKHVQEAPPSLRQFVPHLAPGLESIVLKALSKDPAQRYDGANEMQKALQIFRQLGEQGTAPFAPVLPQSAPLSIPASGAAVAAIPTLSQTRSSSPSRRGPFDWLVVFFSMAIIAMIAGWVPLATRLYDIYFRVTPTAAGEPTQQQQPAQQSSLPPVSLPATPTPRVLTSPTPTPLVVPNLVGLTYTMAERALERSGLSVSMAEENSDAVPIGYVVTQTVKAGEVLPPGTTVGVIVSIGSRGIRLPNVLDNNIADARSKLELLGLRIETIEQVSDQIVPGRVISQSPPQNSTVYSGTVVSLFVSRQRASSPVPTATRTPTRTPTTAPMPGPTIVGQRVAVPNLVGMSEEEARRTIEFYRLTTTYSNYQEVDDIDPASRSFFLNTAVGAVVSQDPKPGELVEIGRKMYIAVRRR